MVNSKRDGSFSGKACSFNAHHQWRIIFVNDSFDMGSMFFLTCTDNCPSRGEIPKMLLLAWGNAFGEVVAIVAVSLRFAEQGAAAAAAAACCLLHAACSLLAA